MQSDFPGNSRERGYLRWLGGWDGVVVGWRWSDSGHERNTAATATGPCVGAKKKKEADALVPPLQCESRATKRRHLTWKKKKNKSSRLCGLQAALIVGESRRVATLTSRVWLKIRQHAPFPLLMCRHGVPLSTSPLVNHLGPKFKNKTSATSLKSGPPLF